MQSSHFVRSALRCANLGMQIVHNYERPHAIFSNQFSIKNNSKPYNFHEPHTIDLCSSARNSAQSIRRHAMPQMLSFNAGATTLVQPLCMSRRRPIRTNLTLRARAPAFSALSASIEQTLTSAVGGQVTVGSILGFATGYAVKRIGQLLLVIVGSEIVVMQLMAQRGWIIAVSYTHLTLPTIA